MRSGDGWLEGDAPGRLRSRTPGGRTRLLAHRAEEKALANARQFMWMQGEFTGLAHPVWSSPSGYFSPSNRKAFVEFTLGRRGNPRAASLEDQLRDQQIIAGTPKTVLPKFRRLLEETRPSILGASDGFVSNEDTRTCIRPALSPR